jgi:hypothetical protein
MAERDIRDRICIATKYTAGYRSYALGKNESAAYGATRGLLSGLGVGAGADTDPLPTQAATAQSRCTSRCATRSRNSRPTTSTSVRPATLPLPRIGRTLTTSPLPPSFPAVYMHWLDYTTSIEEVMDALHILVQQGKVLYLGVSDTPAWWVSAANTYARYNGKTPFVIYQVRKSLISVSETVVL